MSEVNFSFDIQPYQFEPLARNRNLLTDEVGSDFEEASEQEENANRIGNLNWLYRYVAYRRCVRWIWHRLPKKMRKVLPSCVVNKIREAFPSEDYVGFHYAMP